MGPFISWLGSWMMNPVMLGLGALAILSPIIIHLLNRRRFKIIDWAAMEFLLDANRKNRRRVKLENFILLLLRCLAMLLIGFMLARPFLSSNLAIFGDQPVERVFLLDDSLSMSLRIGDEESAGRSTVFDNAKKNIETTLREIAKENRGDLVTLFVTSNPQSPLVSSKSISGDTQNEFSDLLSTLTTSDRTAAMDVALQGVSEYLATLKKNADRLVYVVTDLRERDWKDDSEEENETSARNILKSIAEQANACYLVNAGIPTYANLVVKSIRPIESLRAGVGTRFDVTVANQGSKTADNVKVSFRTTKASAGADPDQDWSSIASNEIIKELPAGEERTVTFQFLSPIEDFIDAAAVDAPGAITQIQSVQVQASIEENDRYDRLIADSTAFYAARVVKGNPILLVDGDPQADPLKTETIFLRRAIDPPNFVSGNMVDVIAVSELLTHPVSPYQVIFLCNIDTVSEDRLVEIEKWVGEGGGLVIMPGDQIIAEDFNDNFYKAGKGLSPARLTETLGDIDELRWANFSVPESVHPMMRIFEGQNNPLINSVKIFSWWGSEIDPDQDGKTITRVASFTDDLDSPAIVEKSYGKGRVIFTSFPADRSWTSWPDQPSYLVAVQEMIKHLCDDQATASDLRIGEALQVPIDLALYSKDAAISYRSSSDESSESERFSVQAIPAQAEEKQSNIWRVNFDDADRRGFYNLKLKGSAGNPSTQLLFAANVDPREGDLRPLDQEEVGAEYFGDKAKLIATGEMAGQTVKSNQSELWRYLLYLLGAILGLELLLGWLFGRRR